MMQRMIRYTLTKEEVEALQEKIVREHWMPVFEAFSLHIYEARYEIEGETYTFYKALGRDEPPIVEKGL